LLLGSGMRECFLTCMSHWIVFISN